MGFEKNINVKAEKSLLKWDEYLNKRLGAIYWRKS
jgi:hypothetical protein